MIRVKLSLKLWAAPATVKTTASCLEMRAALLWRFARNYTCAATAADLAEFSPEPEGRRPAAFSPCGGRLGCASACGPASTGARYGQGPFGMRGRTVARFWGWELWVSVLSLAICCRSGHRILYKQAFGVSRCLLSGPWLMAYPDDSR